MGRVVRSFGAVVSAALTVAACSGSGRAAGAGKPAASTIPAGYTVFQDRTDRLRIAVPGAWRQVDPSRPDATTAAKDVAAAYPALRSLIGRGDLADKDIKFLAVAPGGASHVYIVVKAAAGARDSDLRSVVDTYTAQYTQAGATVESIVTVPVAGHQALQVQLIVPANDGSGGTTSWHEIQDILVANDRAYVVTLTGASPDLAKIESSLALG